MSKHTPQLSVAVEGPASGLRVDLALPEEGRKRRIHPGIMIGIQEGDVLLQCNEWFRPRTGIVLMFDRITLLGTVRYSNPKENGYRMSVAVGAEASGRASPRFPIDEPGTLIVLGDSGTVCFECQLMDFSRAGLGLESASEVAVESMVCIETSAIMVVGRVRRCVRHEDGNFRIGVTVTDVLSDRSAERVSRWSIAGFRLRLAELILGRPIDTARHTTPFSHPPH